MSTVQHVIVVVCALLQMAYCHFEGQDQLLVSAKVTHSPEALLHFLVGTLLPPQQWRQWGQSSALVPLVLGAAAAAGPAGAGAVGRERL